jgi:hypothetical protein
MCQDGVDRAGDLVIRLDVFHLAVDYRRWTLWDPGCKGQSRLEDFNLRPHRRSAATTPVAIES